MKRQFSHQTLMNIWSRFRTFVHIGAVPAFFAVSVIIGSAVPNAVSAGHVVS